MIYPDAHSIAHRQHKIDWDKVVRIAPGQLEIRNGSLVCRIRYVKRADSVLAAFCTETADALEVEEVYRLTAAEIMHYENKLIP